MKYSINYLADISYKIFSHQKHISYNNGLLKCDNGLGIEYKDNIMIIKGVDNYILHEFEFDNSNIAEEMAKMVSRVVLDEIMYDRY